MAKLKVLSKGKYLDPQPNQPTTLCQYIFAIQDKMKYLLLRFKNERTETLTGVKIAVRQLNAKGNEIETSIVECNNLHGAGNGMFTLNKKIAVQKECADFKVYLISASYGKYVYTMKNHATYLTYNEAITAPRISSEDVFSKMGNAKRLMSVRKINKPAFTAVMAIISLVMIIAAAAIQVNSHRSNSKTFTLYNIVYEFNSDETVTVTGYRGDAVNVTIPETVEGYKITAMGENAFANNQKVRSVVIDAPITVAKNAFFNCDSLQTVELSQVTSIGESAFESCDSLVSFSADSLHDIGKKAFYQCYLLAIVDVKNDSNTLRIGKDAFANCSSLNTFTIDQQIDYGHNVSFLMGSTVNELYLDNLPQRSINALFGDSTAHVTKLTVDYLKDIPTNFLSGSRVEGLVINTLGVKAVKDFAFEGVDSLKEVTFNSTVESLGVRAFANTSIKTFNLKGVKEIGEGVFAHSQLESVNFTGSGIEVIPSRAFDGCDDLASVTISDGITEICSLAFSDCEDLKELTVPSSVVSLGAGVLHGCNDLEKLVVPYIGGSLNDNKVMGYLFQSSEDSDSYYAPSSLKTISVTLPEETVVPANAFYGFSGLETVEFASPITAVKSHAFDGCRKFKNFPFSDQLIAIGTSAFEGAGFTALDLPSSIKTIGESAFSDNQDLKKITVPSSVTSIGDSFIYGCGSLEEITLPFIGNSATESVSLIDFCGDSAISNIKKVNVTSDEYVTVANNTFAGASSLESVVLPSQVSVIGDGAFFECSSLKRINLPQTVRSMGESVFSYSGITEFTVPESLKTIEAQAFRECRALRQITLHAGVERIGDDAFENCYFLHEIYNNSALDITLGSYDNGSIAKNALIVYTNGETAAPKTTLNGCEFLYANGTWFLTYCEEDLKNVTFPESIKYASTTMNTYDIANYVFMNKYSIETVSVPSAVRTIGASAFYNCTSLSSVTVSGNGLINVGDRAFYNCNLLEEFNFVPSIEYIGEEAFYNCSSLKELNLSCAVEHIYNNTFSGCYSVESLTLPTGLISIGNSAFQNCNKVLNVVLPTTLTRISDNAFLDCYSLMSVWNRSSLNITQGAGSYGGVALYAKTVRSRSQSYEFEVFEQGDFEVIHDNDNYWIYRYIGRAYSGELVKLPENINHNGNVAVCYGLFKEVFNASYELYVPTAVTKMDDRVFANVRPSRIYYASTQNKWNSLFRNLGYSVSVYFYSKCVHYDGYWKYDSEGNISLDREVPQWVSVQAPTCTTSGYSRYNCPTCTYTEERTDYALGHSFQSNGKCSRCTATRVRITSQNINDYSQYVKFNLGADFTIDENGLISSTNTEADSTAKMYITIEKPGITLEFVYGANSSTGSNYAYFDDFECGRRELTGISYHEYKYTRSGTIEFGFYRGSPYYPNDYGLIRDIYVIIP